MHSKGDSLRMDLDIKDIPDGEDQEVIYKQPTVTRTPEAADPESQEFNIDDIKGAKVVKPLGDEIKEEL